MPSPVGSTSYPQPTTCEVYYDRVLPGIKDSSSVYWVQRWLNNVILPAAPLVMLTGTYDTTTMAAAEEFQASLGDDEDGDLGPLQIAALWRRASIVNPVLPTPALYADSTKDAMPDPIVTLNAGSGNLQGAIQDQSGDWIVPEATTEGDCILHRFDLDGEPLDTMRLKVKAGFDVHPVGWAVDNGEVWLTWNEATNNVVRFPYKGGTTITKAQTKTVNVFSSGNCRVSLSPGRDFAAVERLRTDVEEYRWYAKQALLDGRNLQLGKTITVARDLKRRTVQGYGLVDDTLMILTGRPSTKEPTLITRYSFTTGKVTGVKEYNLDGEAETVNGRYFCMKDGHGKDRRLHIYPHGL